MELKFVHKKEYIQKEEANQKHTTQADTKNLFFLIDCIGIKKLHKLGVSTPVTFHCVLELSLKDIFLVEEVILLETFSLLFQVRSLLCSVVVGSRTLDTGMGSNRTYTDAVTVTCTHTQGNLLGHILKVFTDVGENVEIVIV